MGGFVRAKGALVALGLVALGPIALGPVMAAPAMAGPAAGPAPLTAEQALGRALFFDTSLSNPPGQACASCHDAATAFTDPDHWHPTSKGVDPTLFGSRSAPSVLYAAFSPTFHFDKAEGLWIGGQFSDGRAATLEDQAKQPFVNPIEMANTAPAQVVARLKAGPNAARFASVYGAGALDDAPGAYDRIARAIAAFERTRAFAPFTSKFDDFRRGLVRLTPQEQRGFDLFTDKAKGNCAACHITEPADAHTPALFTDFTYDNVGIPKNYASGYLTNPHNPDGPAFIDRGLGAVVHDPALDGAFKVPTLRNLALTAPYGHNGYFDTMEQIVTFYATRDTRPACANPKASAREAMAARCWPPAEVPGTVNRDEMGNLPLNQRDIADLVAFLNTLTDGYDPATGEAGTAPSSQAAR
ncbi:MAG: c-type cytochrome [Alphaproteobacteria bacterium]|nr:c-type cytochrome [Alphaproteobacteria bacterium]MCB9930259.1 c-type cytochrome [Alphaproteobacteria bacterium]